MIELKNLHKSFGQTEVLKGVSLTVNKGDVISIIGPSGSGKTTLLRCLNFLEKSDDGELTFNDEKINLPSVSKKKILEIRKKCGFVFQNYNLFRNKTALQNITEGLVTARKVKKTDANKIALDLLKKVGLEGKENSFPHQLSGGQQQRVAIARSLAYKPEIIYFDEPTSALDPKLTFEVLDVIKNLAKEGMTMIIVTHEMNFAKNISTKVIFMEDGQIIEEGTSSEIFKFPKNGRTKEFLSNLNSDN